MGTSTSKALRRQAHGQPSKIRSSLPSRSADAAIVGVGRSRKKGESGRSIMSVSPSGRSTRGFSASVPGRVSHAKRSARRQELKAAPGNAVMRKRRNSKTVNLRGRYSTPDLRAVDDAQTLARATGRRNKATATVAALKKG